MKMIKNSNSIIHINLLHCLSHADWDWKIKFCAATHQICRMPTNNHLEMQREHVERCRPHWESLLLRSSPRFRPAVWQLVSIWEAPLSFSVWHNGSHYSGAAGWPTSDCCLGERLHSSSARRSLTYITSCSCSVSPPLSVSANML